MKIASIDSALYQVPLAVPLSDSTHGEIPSFELITVRIRDDQGLEGLGYTYTVGVAGLAIHVLIDRYLKPDLLGQDPGRIEHLWERMWWRLHYSGRGGTASFAISAIDIALWDLTGKRQGTPLWRLLGGSTPRVKVYAGGVDLHFSLDALKDQARRFLARGYGAIKMKVGRPRLSEDIARVRAIRELIGPDVPLMVDANQQWDRPTAQRMCRVFEQFNLVWIEEPLDAYDHEGHAALAVQFDTPIATGEMLTSAAEHGELIRHRAADYLMPDAPRVGGITPFLKIAAQAEHAGLMLGPHFAMELHVRLAAAYPTEPWVEHFDWLEPLFNERLEIKGGRMVVPTRPGLGLTLSEQSKAWTREIAEVGARP